jgi:hypothetical protein
VHHNGFDAQFTTGALNAQGNFPAIRDEDFPEHNVISR